MVGSLSASASLILLAVIAAIIVIPVIIIRRSSKKERAENEIVAEKVTIESPKPIGKRSELKIKEKTVRSEKATPSNFKKNILPIVICAVFLLICLAVILWPMLK